MSKESEYEISLKKVTIVDYNIIRMMINEIVIYKLKIETYTDGIFYCWKRYSDFKYLYTNLKNKKNYKKKDLPYLPPRMLMGNLNSNNIMNRMDKLNKFLEKAYTNENLQWGIYIDKI